MQRDFLALAHGDLVRHRRGSCDQFKLELALETFLNDFKMKQAKETTTETKTKGGRVFRFELEGRVIEVQLFKRITQHFIFAGIDREDTTEHHRNGRLETGQRLGAGAFFLGNRVTNFTFGNRFHTAVDEANFTRAEFIKRKRFWREHADTLNLMGNLGVHEADFLALFKGAFLDAHKNHHTQIGVIPTINQKNFKRCIRIPGGRGQTFDQRVKNIGHTHAGLGRNHDRVRGINANDFLDLFLDPVRFRSRKIDLVENRDDFMIVFNRLINVGKSLGFHALRGIHHQKRPFAGGQ